jgi:uncharacterized membrane protein
MNKLLRVKDPYTIILSLILVVAAILRFYGLTNQSLWVDELHTMIEADPTIHWSQMFEYLRGIDQHPPLFFIIERVLFYLFGHTEGVARSFPAMCGLVSVWAMYLLGKELLDKKLGTIAALITCINYFNIDYSQEARCYIMAFLFATFSYLYFIKLMKSLLLRHLYPYVFFTVLMLYSHYYSLFVVAAQGLVALVLLLGQKGDKKQFIKVAAIGSIIIVISYLPWAPFLIAMSKIESFWISPIESSFGTTYFFDYFGNNQFLQPFLILLLTYFCWQVFAQSNLSVDRIKDSPLQLTFLVFFVAVAVTYLAPYLRSILVVPMLFNRYTIVVLPGFIIVIAFAFVLINNRMALTIMLTAFVALTLMDLLIVRKYYSDRKHRKTQFREMTKFISEDPKRIFPIVEERTAWQHRYYLKKYNNNAPILSGNKEATIDSILTSPNYDLDGFWIVGAHGFEPHLLHEVQQKLDTTYTLMKQREFYDAWAQLYIRTDSTKNVTWDSAHDVTWYFPGRANYFKETVVPIWGGTIASQSILVKPNSYNVRISHVGTKASGVYPHIKVFINDKKIGEFYTSEYWTENSFRFEVQNEQFIVIKLDFDNDLSVGGKDRNAFIKSVFVEKSMR